MPSSKFEADLMLSLQVRHASLSLIPLASLILKDYLHAYAIIDVFANRLIFVNTVINMLYLVYYGMSSDIIEIGLLMSQAVLTH